jgi:hypothetical protein
MAEIIGFTGQEAVDGRQDDEYQPPRLTPIGNARELLAGASGSVADVMGPPNPIKPFQAG